MTRLIKEKVSVICRISRPFFLCHEEHQGRTISCKNAPPVITGGAQVMAW